MGTFDIRFVETRYYYYLIQRWAKKFFCFTKHHPGSARQKYTQPGKWNLADLSTVRRVRNSFASSAINTLRRSFVSLHSHVILASGCVTEKGRELGLTNFLLNTLCSCSVWRPPPCSLSSLCRKRTRWRKEI